LVVDEQDGPSAVLNETVTMVSFSTVPGASRQLQTKAVSDATENVEGVMLEADAQGEDGRCRRRAMWDQMTRHLDDYSCSAEQ